MNPAKAITLELRKTEIAYRNHLALFDTLFSLDSVFYMWQVSWYKSKIFHLKQKLYKIRHFVA